MSARSVSGRALGAQPSLHALERVGVDERRMPPVRVGGAHEHDSPYVVGIAEHGVHARPRERDRRPLASWPCPQAHLFQVIAQASDAVLATVVEIEGELDKRRAFLVDHDRVNEPALELDGRVLVADRCGEGRATGLVLLDLAFADLVSQVLVLILGEGRADAVVELARRRAVDVLHDRDQLRSGLVEPVGDHRIVHRVTGEAVELVHDREVDVAVALDVVDHRHEPRPVLGLGGLRQVDVLADNDRPSSTALRSQASRCAGIE